MNRLRREQTLSPLDLSDRSDKVRSKLSKSEAVVVMDPPNVQWMTGFTGSNGTVYIDHERFVLITDQRYQEQGPLEIMQTRSTAELAISKNSIEELPKLAGRKTIKLDSNKVTWASAVRLGETLEGDIVPSATQGGSGRWCVHAEAWQHALRGGCRRMSRGVFPMSRRLYVRGVPLRGRRAKGRQRRIVTLVRAAGEAGNRDGQPAAPTGPSARYP